MDHDKCCTSVVKKQDGKDLRPSSNQDDTPSLAIPRIRDNTIPSVGIFFFLAHGFIGPDPEMKTS